MLNEVIERTEVSTETTSAQLFQGVRCGMLAVAFPYGWATKIVEQFSLSPIPKAPAWLAGAANIDGRIVPVIDLAHFRSRAARVDSGMTGEINVRKQRLLIGGLSEKNDDSRLAILFEGLPEQVRRRSIGLANDSMARTGEATLTDGFAYSNKNERFAVVNVEHLCTQLMDELSTL